MSTETESGARNAHKVFWHFADITVIHGFSYANRSRHWSQALFWLLAIAICVGLAVNDLYTLITTYMAEPTTTNINLHFNATSKFALPNAVICIDARLECLNLPTAGLSMPTTTTSTTTTTTSTMTTTTSTNPSTESSMAYPSSSSMAYPPSFAQTSAYPTLSTVAQLNLTSVFGEIENAFSAAPNTFNLTSLSAGAIATVIRMFSLIAAMEDINLDYNFAGKPQNPPYDYPSTGVFENFYANSPDETYLDYSTLAPLYTLRTTLAAAGVNFTELAWQIGEIICMQFTPFSATAVPSLADVCSRDRITWVGSGALRTEVCLRVDSSFFTFSANDASRTIGLCNSALVGFNQSVTMPCNYAPPPHAPGTSGPLFNTSGPFVYSPTCVSQQTMSTTGTQEMPPTFYFDPGGERRFSSSSAGWVTPYTAQSISTTSVLISGVYEAVSTNADPCSTNDTIAECMLRCRKAFFMTNCSCYPVSLYSLVYDKPPGMPYCVNLDLAPPLQQNGSGNSLMYMYFGIGFGAPTSTSTAGYITFLNFSACLARNFEVEKPLDSCLSSCVHECRATTFTVTSSGVAATKANVNTEDPLTGLNISVSSTVLQTQISISQWLYPEYQETFLMTATSFLASFGGSLGIWLGASIISVVHVAVFFMDYLVQHCHRSREMKSELPTTAAGPPPANRLYGARPAKKRLFSRATRF